MRLEIAMCSKTEMQTGIVDVDGKRKQVEYCFVDCCTIKCVDQQGNEFETHYKSLVMED